MIPQEFFTCVMHIYFSVVFRRVLHLRGGSGDRDEMDPPGPGQVDADSYDPRQAVSPSAVVAGGLHLPFVVPFRSVFRPELGPDDAGPHGTQNCPELWLGQGAALRQIHHAAAEEGKLFAMHTAFRQRTGQYHRDHSLG